MKKYDREKWGITEKEYYKLMDAVEKGVVDGGHQQHVLVRGRELAHTAGYDGDNARGENELVL